MRTTSIEPIFNSPGFHRRFDSDNDSAISMSPDNAGIEKQRTMSMIEAYDKRTPWPWNSLTAEPTLFVLPSFISRRLRRQPKWPERRSGMVALDGLRGIACLLVLNERLTGNYTHSFLVSSGLSGTQDVPIQWPLIRVLWSGFTMINIFFIITGYILSHEPLRQMYSGNILDAHRHLTSSTIRTGLRLYIPTLLAIFISATFAFLGAFDSARNSFDHDNNVYGLVESSPPHFVNYLEQMKDAGRHALKMFDLWRQTDDQLHAGRYDLYAWIVPVEFRNSMILLMSLFAVSRLRKHYRFASILAFIGFSILTQNRSVVLFLSGMLLADIDQMLHARFRHLSYSSYYHETSSTLLTIFSPRSPLYPILFVLGMWICSIPAIGAENDPIFKHLRNLIPTFLAQKTEWVRVPGSIMIVWAAANSAILQPLFTNRVSRYLGKISFSLYLVHGNILKIVLHTFLPVLYQKLGDGTKQGQTTQQLVIAWIFGVTMCLSLSIWVADIFWRAIELPTIRFAKWFENQVSEDDEMDCPSPKRWD